MTPGNASWPTSRTDTAPPAAEDLDQRINTIVEVRLEQQEERLRWLFQSVA